MSKYRSKESILKLKKEGLTQTEIGKRLGVSQMQISKLSRYHKIEWNIGAAARSNPETLKTNFKDGFSKSSIERLTRKLLAETGKNLHICERCGWQDKYEELPRHHKDRDRTNNDLTNLEIICKSCHRIEHISEQKRDPITGRFYNDEP